MLLTKNIKKKSINYNNLVQVWDHLPLIKTYDKENEKSLHTAIAYILNKALLIKPCIEY